MKREKTSAAGGRPYSEPGQIPSQSTLLDNCFDYYDYDYNYHYYYYNKYNYNYSYYS